MSLPYEITIDIQGISENTYRPSVAEETGEGNIEGDLLFNELILTFPEILEPPFPPVDRWKLIGKTQKNNVNYFDETISISIDGRPSPELLTYLDIDSVDLFTVITAYTLKFKLKERKVVLKIYGIDPDLPDVALPEGAFTNIETGKHLNDPRLNHFRDFYMYSELPPSALAAFFGLAFPEGYTCYGLLLDTQLNTFVKCKAYTYPQTGDKEEFVKDTRNIQHLINDRRGLSDEAG